MAVTVKTCSDVLSPGDHVAVDRVLYTHHAIYVGFGRAICLVDTGIIEDDCDNMIGDSDFWIVEHEDADLPDVIVERAKSKLHNGCDQYNLFTNNCEHFCEWCATGTAWSHQVFGLALGTIFGGWLGHVAGYVLGQWAVDGGSQRYRLCEPDGGA